MNILVLTAILFFEKIGFFFSGWKKNFLFSERGKYYYLFLKLLQNEQNNQFF